MFPTDWNLSLLEVKTPPDAAVVGPLKKLIVHGWQDNARRPDFVRLRALLLILFGRLTLEGSPVLRPKNVSGSGSFGGTGRGRRGHGSTDCPGRHGCRWPWGNGHRRVRACSKHSPRRCASVTLTLRQARCGSKATGVVTLAREPARLGHHPAASNIHSFCTGYSPCCQRHWACFVGVEQCPRRQ
jgi:hypothetical protein